MAESVGMIHPPIAWEYNQASLEPIGCSLHGHLGERKNSPILFLRDLKSAGLAELFQKQGSSLGFIRPRIGIEFAIGNVFALVIIDV